MQALTDSLKRKALEMGVVKVGVAKREDLEGPPEANMDRIMPGAACAISIAALEPEELILDYLSKKNPKPYRNHFYENVQLLGRVGLALAEALQARGYRAESLSPNGVYAEGSSPGRLLPPFAHRYAAHAAGIGAIALSGNVMTPEYGARVYLGTVITDAPLVADGPLDESPCDDCKLCLHACAAGFMSVDERVGFTLGGREITHARKGAHLRCGICCAGFTGLSRHGKWSTLAPSLRPIPEDDDEVKKLFAETARRRFRDLSDHPEAPNFFRLSQPMPGYEPDKQGILARPKSDTHTTCGNCAIVCLETRKQRAQALKTLFNSGVVVGERDDGSPIVLGADEARAYRERHAP